MLAVKYNLLETQKKNENANGHLQKDLEVLNLEYKKLKVFCY